MCEVIREAFGRQELAKDTIDVMIKSLAKSTLQQYNSTYKLWFSFCNDNKLDFFNVTIPMLLKFLTNQFNNGASYSSLNSIRSALSLILGKTCCTNDYVTRFLKGVFKIRPNLPKYQNCWDPNIVLSHISNQFPNESLTLDVMTKKLVTLLALSTGQRVQTLSLIKLCNITITETSIDIIIDEIIKTSAPNKPNPRLKIPFFQDKPCICPARALSVYISMTKDLRNEPSTDRLILTTKRPIHNASSQSLSRWIKSVLKDSGVDVSVYTSHSTRHASTSAARRAGVSVDVIKRAAGWTGSSLCFAKFYNLPLPDPAQDRAFAEAVLNENLGMDD